jgi:hypothetical protein
MTLRALWTYDHIANASAITLTSLAAYTPNNAYNLLTGNPGTPILRAGTANVVINALVAGAAPGAYRGGGIGFGNSTSQAQALVVALADVPLLQGGVTKAYIGFRTWSSVIPAPGTSSVFGVASSATAVPTALVNETQLARVVNVTQYVEVMLDIANNQYSAWVDGLKIVDKAALVAGFTYLVFGSNAVTTNSCNFSFQDFYFVDADATLPNTRLGPIQSALATIAAVSAPNYTSSDAKTPLADFTTAYSAAPAATPNITNAATNDPVTVNFTSQAPAGAGMIAVQYKMAASVTATAQMSAQLKQASTTKNLPTYTFSDLTMDFGRDLSGVQTTDPSGNAWSDAGLAATALIVQPVSLT